MEGAPNSSVMAVVMVIVMAAFMQLQGTVAQTRHLVGDAMGWSVPAGGPAAYTTWASRQTFTVGDILVFNFTTGVHNVAEVTQAAYGRCTASNPISFTATGPATLTLTTAGSHYYICTVGPHCQIGQKVTITASAGAATIPPPTAAPSPSPAGTTTPSGGAPSFSAGILVTFLSIVLALF